MMRHLSPISGIAVGSKYVATAGYDNRVILWDRTNLEPLSIGFHDHLVNQCELSTCEQLLVTSSSDHSARLWQLPEMRLIKVFNVHSDDIEFATFDKSSQRIATASRDGTIVVSNIYNNNIKRLTGHEADVLSVCFVDDYLISCSDDGTIRKWNLEDLENTILTKSDFQTDTVAINGEIIFAGDDAGILYIIQNNKVDQVQAHNSGIKRLYFFNNDQLLISMAYDRQCILWKVTNNILEELHRFNLPNIVWPRSCAVYENQIYFATFGSSFGVYDYKKQVWNLEHIAHTPGINAIGLYNNKIYKIGDSGQLKINNNCIYSTNSLANFIIQFDNNILVGGQNGQLIDTTANRTIFQYKSPLNCAINFNGKLFVGTYIGEILIFDNLVNNPRIIRLHNNAIKDIIGLNQQLISVCANGEICKYDILLDYKLFVNGHNNIINSCAAINNKFFVTVSRDKKMKIWDIESFSCSKEIDTLHTHSIKAVAVSSDGKYIASGSYNGTVYILDYDLQKWIKKRLTNAGISCLKYDGDNKQFIVGSYDGQVYFLPIESFHEYQ